MSEYTRALRKKERQEKLEKDLKQQREHIEKAIKALKWHQHIKIAFHLTKSWAKNKWRERQYKKLLKHIRSQ